MSADAHQADPFSQPENTSEQAVTQAASIALVWSIIYLAWRGLFTVFGADAPASLVLFAAEILAGGVFAARVRSARKDPVRVIESPDAPLPDTAAVVDATGTSVDELRTTLVSLRRIAGVERIVVVDREGSRWLRTISERLDATVVDRSVSFDEAVRTAGTSWVLVLRSGDLPMPDLVSVCAPRCSSPDVAVLQVGIEEADPTSFEHDPDSHWSLEAFEQQVVRPSLAAWGSIPWYGDGPAMVRRAALDTIEPPSDGHLLNDSRRVGLDLIRSGMTVTHLPLMLARVRGPSGIGESLMRRHQRARSAVRALLPRDLKRIDRPERIAHLLAILPFAGAIQRLFLVVAALLVLGLAQTPIDAPTVALASFAVPTYLLRWHAHRVLGRGRLGLLSILRSDLRSIGVDLIPFGRVEEKARRAGLSSVVVIVIALVGAVFLAAASMWRSVGDQLSIGVALPTLVITVGFLGVAIEVLFDATLRRQRRANHRIRLGLVTCRIEELDGQLVDLSTGGAGIVVAASPDKTPAVGSVTTVAFRIPDADGAWKSVSALVHIAHAHPEPGGGTRIGLRFDEPTDAPLDPVIEFLTIDRRLVALGRNESVAN